MANLEVVDGGGKSSVLDYVVRAHCVRLEDVSDVSVRDLFFGFDTLRAITFSYSVDFLDEVLGMFKNAEVLLGGEFLVRKDRKIHSAIAEALAYAKDVEYVPERHPNFGVRMREGTLALKAANCVLDHRKIYILSATDGRTRVVTGSANMSGRAWNGEHEELYEFDDSELAYDVYMRLFDAAWAMGGVIPPLVTEAEHLDFGQGNAVIKGVIEMDQMFVTMAGPDVVAREHVEYVLKHEYHRDLYDEALSGASIGRPNKNGVYSLRPAAIQRLMNAIDAATRKRWVEEKIATASYPKLEYELGDGAAVYVDGQALDLNPTKADVRQDLTTLFAMFSNFETDFHGNIEGLMRNHWKFLVWAFVSPYAAGLRCACSANGRASWSLPLFVILSSRQANSGKTFAAEAVQCMMLGKKVGGLKGKDAKLSDKIRGVQADCKGVPFLIDEVDNKVLANSITGFIKASDKCEHLGNRGQPVIVLTSNEAVDPGEHIRKRSIFLLFDAALRTDVDKNAYANKGSRLLGKFTGALYREYSRRILPEISKMEDLIYKSGSLLDEWYPDLVKLSSGVFLSIFRDFGADPLPCMTYLEWNKDYYSVEGVAKDAVREMQSLYESNPDVFEIRSGRVVVRMGPGTRESRMLTGWYNTMPPEANARCVSGRDCIELSADLDVLEHFGLRISGRFDFLGFLRQRRR